MLKYVALASRANQFDYLLGSRVDGSSAASREIDSPSVRLSVHEKPKSFDVVGFVVGVDCYETKPAALLVGALVTMFFGGDQGVTRSIHVGQVSQTI